MNVHDLLSIPPADLAKLSDQELADRLAPLIPQARAAYIGPRTGTIMVGDRRVQKRAYQNKEKLIETLLKSQGINI